MRLYPKKLRSVKDLEREHRLLQKEIKLMDEEGIMSVEGLLGSKGKGGFDASSLMDMLPVSNPIVALLVKLVQKKIADKRNSAPKDAYMGGSSNKSKSRLKALAVEIIGGYLKWKAIEVSYKAIRRYLKKNRDSKVADRTF